MSIRLSQDSNKRSFRINRNITEPSRHNSISINAPSDLQHTASTLVHSEQSASNDLDFGTEISSTCVDLCPKRPFSHDFQNQEARLKDAEMTVTGESSTVQYIGPEAHIKVPSIGNASTCFSADSSLVLKPDSLENPAFKLIGNNAIAAGFPTTRSMPSLFASCGNRKPPGSTANDEEKEQITIALPSFSAQNIAPYDSQITKEAVTHHARYPSVLQFILTPNSEQQAELSAYNLGRFTPDIQLADSSEASVTQSEQPPTFNLSAGHLVNPNKPSQDQIIDEFSYGKSLKHWSTVPFQMIHLKTTFSIQIYPQLVLNSL
ncbi:hypothetical protein GALMADRAFT_144041 [Galerina marginata CBS 339.88]|uniref:Uncharacterized protein n=1 Tax=Galerina marginata (strain CBS 339.88) TaxID=685588 RepID=A0A067SKC6_GALM3|nr:hypothetical protein GALMADRAFT_144041 [Galerina marginata CBS 339.88]